LRAQLIPSCGGRLEDLQFGVIMRGPDALDIPRPAPRQVHDLHRCGTRRRLHRPHIRGHQATLRPRFSAQIRSPQARNPQVLDYYLVLTGPRSALLTSRGGTRPWRIDHVYLFHAPTLLAEQQSRGVKAGVAASVRKRQWESAEIYPDPEQPAPAALRPAGKAAGAVQSVLTRQHTAR